ncbi:MAG: DUF4255 domain-containing protein [Actinomycetota bacterium]|nr:DUF4255 domain-containing protein [Actinomycetota bacterium]
MIHDVDESLQTLIRRDVTNGSNVELSFEAPTKEWSAKRQGPTLNLYLYDIREDLERRRVQYEEVRDERGFVVDRRQPARRFKLEYLITAWTQRPEDEHRLLSAVLSAFAVSDALPADVLQGSLAQAGEPIRATIALPLGPNRSLADVWNALGGELKPSLDLIITAPFGGRLGHVGPPVLEGPYLRLLGPDGQPLERVRPRPQEAESEVALEQIMTEETVDGGRFSRGKTAEAADRKPQKVDGEDGKTEQEEWGLGRRVTIRTIPRYPWSP